MTAREFIESLKEKPAWEDLQLGKGLFELTEFLGDETQVDYKQFPDANLPEKAFEDPEFEFKFEQFLEKYFI